MRPTDRRKHLLAQLETSLANLDKAARAMAYSKGKCVTIGAKTEYDLEEQEVFEALTARFARAADILTQQTFKTVFALLQEDARTKLDAANLAEKLGIVEDANILLNIRELRNQIAHEYVGTHLGELFLDVLRYVPELEKVIARLKGYCQRFDSGRG